MSFTSAQESHQHSLETLELLCAYPEFMESIDSVCDIGCGKEGLDLEWWATREVDVDDVLLPLNINCTGIDINEKLLIQHDNITYVQHDFETQLDKQFDVLYCHDSFQYALNPLLTLSNWYNMLIEGGMLALQVPSTTNLEYNKSAYSQPNYHYYNHTVDSLIHMLSVNGFDCNSGFFQQQYNDPWIKAIVYKSDIEPMNPKNTSWYDLADKGLLPKTGVESINKYGYMKREDLVLPWLDYSNIWYGQ
jgi:SAM-dependent methyltransferase